VDGSAFEDDNDDVSVMQIEGIEDDFTSDEEDEPQWLAELAVTLYPSLDINSTDELIDSWQGRADFPNVSMEAWSPTSVGVLVPLDVASPPLSVQSSLLPTVQWLASQPEVEWIEMAAEFETMNKHAAEIMQVIFISHHELHALVFLHCVLICSAMCVLASRAVHSVHNLTRCGIVRSPG
jgi:hypothetical protein